MSTSVSTLFRACQLSGAVASPRKPNRLNPLRRLSSGKHENSILRIVLVFTHNVWQVSKRLERIQVESQCSRPDSKPSLEVAISQDSKCNGIRCCAVPPLAHTETTTKTRHVLPTHGHEQEALISSLFTSQSSLFSLTLSRHSCNCSLTSSRYCCGTPAALLSAAAPELCTAYLMTCVAFNCWFPPHSLSNSFLT